MGSWIRALVLGGLMAAAVACGDGGDGTGSPTASPNGGAAGITAEAWLTDVCGATKTWVDEIVALQADLQEDIDTTSVKTLKRTMVGYFGDVVASTDDMLEEIDAAGVPDAEGGATAASAVSEGLHEVRDVLDRARDDAADLPTDDARVFGRRLQGIAREVQTSLTDVGSTMAELRSPELDRAADDVQACEELEAL